MSLVTLLDQKLTEFCKQQESQKTWVEWVEWIESFGLAMAGQRSHSSSPINYREFLQSFAQKEQLPHAWKERLTDPAWLSQQGVFLFPSTSSNTSTIPLDYVTVEKFNQFVTELQRLQGKVYSLEKALSQKSENSALQQQEMTSPPVQASATALGQLNSMQTLEKELAVHHWQKKQKLEKEKQSLAQNSKEQLKPLQEVYLTVNEWLTQFTVRGFDLQQFSSQPISVTGSHQISFTQFGKRMARRVENLSSFEVVLARFQEMHQDGFAVLPSEGVISDVAQVVEPVSSFEDHPRETPKRSSSFVPPSQEQYMEFNSWLSWLREQGIEPSDYSSENLKIESSHRISFPQFCKRVERKLTDIEGFRKAIAGNTLKGNR